MNQRPSFVLFITDQHRADYLGCYGHQTLRTPHIDRLAAEGVAFDRFYVASPVCMPNRASLMTCRMPSSHGVWTNGTPLSTRQVTFVELLRDAGYDTALIGKSHLQNFSMTAPAVAQPAAGPGELPTSPDNAHGERSGFEDPAYGQERPVHWDRPEAELRLPFYGFDHVDLVTGHGDGAGGAYKRWLRTQRPDADALIGPQNQLPHDYVCPQAVRTAMPEELYTTSWIADRALDWIAARKDSERPFFLMVSWPDPHHPFNPPGRYWDMYRPEDMTVPDAFLRGDWQPPAYLAASIEERRQGKSQTGGFGSFVCTAREAQEARALTCGMITMIDDCLGRVQSGLDEMRQRNRIVRIFTADHGENLGDHMLLLKGAEPYEQITRVPFIWADPEGPKGQREAGIGQTHDIGPSVIKRAKVQPAWGMQGQALSVAGGSARGEALIQYDQQRAHPVLGALPRVHVLRDERYRLSLFHCVAGGELYDLLDDPGEFRNLWDDPAHQAVKAALMERLARAEIAATDRLPVPNGLA